MGERVRTETTGVIHGATVLNELIMDNVPLKMSLPYPLQQHQCTLDHSF